MEISPQNQNIDNVFSNTTYHIDFYQRQYKWGEEPVRRLLEDIFYKFNEEHAKYKDSHIDLEKLAPNYGWYYLNTYVTNQVEGKLFVVDGQQRLTTLTLILVKLLHLTRAQNSELQEWIKQKIMGQAGFKKEFWMNHEAHRPTMLGLYEDKPLAEIPTTSGITAQNMVKNFALISDELDRQLDTRKRLEAFVFYFLKRLVLISLKVEQTEVPMVFEVINDRGVKLKPYEILKGKLLGQVAKDELDELKLNEIWEKQVGLINEFKEDEIDEFFVYYLKAKLANTRGTAVKFDKDYHRVIFDDEFKDFLDIKHNPIGVKEFLLKAFQYFTHLYAKVYTYHNEPNAAQPFVHYNKLTQMDSQFLLILSACRLDDPDEEAKIALVSRQVDRLFCLLQLQRSYNSNSFATEVYKLSAEIREKSLAEIEAAFERSLLHLLSEARGLEVASSLNYTFFKDTGIELEKRFKRYFFARIDIFIAQHTRMHERHNLYDLVSNTGAVNGFHVEHILSHNEVNYALYGGDKEYFERDRNRLGGLLLLKGKDNISSGNESYAKKLKSYANTLFWNESLRDDSYKAKKDFTAMIQQFQLNFRPMPTFGPNEVE